MSRYTRLFTLTLAHDYYSNGPAPIRVDADAAHGLLVKSQPTGLLVAAEEGAELPDHIDLTLTAETPDLLALTAGLEPGKMAHVALELTSGPQKFSDLARDWSHPAQPGRQLSFARLRIPLDGADGQTIGLEFGSIQTVWAYQITGAKPKDRLSVIDQGKKITFGDMAEGALPDGSPVVTIASDEALPLASRSALRFTLMRDADKPDEAQKLIPILPVAGPAYRRLSHPDGSVRLQSDIYVALW